MIARDRELLARAMQVNQQLGAATVALLDKQDGGELPATQLRAVGEHLWQLATDMLDRAAELDGQVTDTDPVVIEAHEQPATMPPADA